MAESITANDANLLRSKQLKVKINALMALSRAKPKAKANLWGK
jgi:hypothetical protein